MTDDRVAVPDPALMRFAGRRAVRALVIVLILTSFFLVGGISAIARGAAAGVPLAVGAGVLDLACTALFVSSRRVTSSLDGHTVSRAALVSARRTIYVVRIGAWVTMLGLLAFGVAGLTADEPWTLIVAALLSVALFALVRATGRLRRTLDQTLSAPS